MKAKTIKEGFQGDGDERDDLSGFRGGSSKPHKEEYPKNELEDRIAEYIEKYRNVHNMTSHRIARNVIEMVKSNDRSWEPVPDLRGDMDPESWGDKPDWRPREMGQ